MVQMDQPMQRLRVAWVPGRQGIEGIEMADRAAKAATERDGRFEVPVQERIRELDSVLRLVERNRGDDPTSTQSARKTGSHTWKLHQALSGRHILELYGRMASDEACTQIQARSGQNRLNASLHTMGIVKSAQCSCGIRIETVEHVLLSCPLWTQGRQILRETVGDKWGDTSFLLGGCNGAVSWPAG